MNPTRNLAQALHSLVAGGPEWLQGLAIMTGILLALGALVALAVVLTYPAVIYLERRHPRLRHRFWR